MNTGMHVSLTGAHALDGNTGANKIAVDCLRLDLAPRDSIGLHGLGCI